MGEITSELDIRYVKLEFTLTFPNSCVLPISKASAIRGGMGEMLLRANCIRDRNCDNCDFVEECIVQRTMYSRFENKPDFMSPSDSVGYVVECENYEEKFEAGDELRFYLILFGRTIVYFNQYMSALFALGQNGLGKDKAKFYISQVKNNIGQPILDGNNIFMEYYQIDTIADYVNRRMKDIRQECCNELKFKSATTIKYHGSFIQEFNMEAIVNAIKRRIYILDLFENIDGEDLYKSQFELPEIIDQDIKTVKTRRYSSRKNAGMPLQGIKGTVVLDIIPDEIMPLLLAGEILHIGKNTSFGFGRYIVK